MLIRSTPTDYRGTRFRSLLERDWASAFTWAGLDWVYEPIVFFRERRRYTPDFQIGPRAVFVETKGDPTLLNRNIYLCNHPLIFILGSPRAYQVLLFLPGSRGARCASWEDAYERAST